MTKEIRILFLSANPWTNSRILVIGTGKGIGDKASVSFAGAFYRALGFGKSVRDAFESATAELALTKMPRSRDIELFIREGDTETDPFPQLAVSKGVSRGTIDASFVLRAEARLECQITLHKTIPVQIKKTSSARKRDSLERYHAREGENVSGDPAPGAVDKGENKMAVKKGVSQLQTNNVVPQKSTRKPVGTRVGTLEDWRGGCNQSGNLGGRYGSSVRDGR